MTTNQPDTRRLQHEGQHDLQREEVRRHIIELAQSLELHITFSEGKRQGDMVVIHVQGEQSHVKAFYNHISKVFPNLAVELFNLDPQWFGVVAAVIDPTQQGHSKTREHRQPMRHHYLTKGD